MKKDWSKDKTLFCGPEIKSKNNDPECCFKLAVPTYPSSSCSLSEVFHLAVTFAVNYLSKLYLKLTLKSVQEL